MRTPFAGIDIAYDERVLQPREWTQAQSQWAAELLPHLPPGDVLELCCGAGQIGLAAVAGSGRRLVAVDINPVAAHYASLNATRANVSLSMRLGPMRQMVGASERFALIIADPPWVPSHATQQFPEDPRIAIDGGAQGMDLIDQCLDIITGHLLPAGAALLQVGPGPEQADAVAARVAGLLPGPSNDTTPKHALTTLAVTEQRHFERGTLLLIEQQSRGRTL